MRAAAAPDGSSLRVQHWPLARLKPSPRNARTHSDEQIEQIAGSIRSFGFSVPILAGPEGDVIAGHARLAAARRLGLEKVPVITLALDQHQRASLALADNRIAQNAGWDMSLLRLELNELFGAGIDLASLGFSVAEIEYIVGRPEGHESEDELAPVPARATTRKGDIWRLGSHRLACGDSTQQAMIDALMAGKLADLCFTSPPYATKRDYLEKIKDWDALMLGVYSHLPVSERAQVLVNLGLVHVDNEWVSYWDAWIAAMREQGWRRFAWYVWDQGAGLPGDWNGRLAPSHEFIFHFNRVAEKVHKTKMAKHAGTQIHAGSMRRTDGSNVRKTHVGRPSGPVKLSDSIIRVTRATKGDHPAVFPVALPREIINAFSDPGDIIYEPFSGSGTQIIAAEETGRTCYAMEIGDIYIDAAVDRWQKFARKQAVLESTGLTFEQMKRKRAKGKGQ